MFRQTERALTEEERARLQAEIAAVEKNSLASAALITALVCFIFAIFTLKLSDAPWYVVVAFWSVLAIAITVWVAIDLRRGQRRQTTPLRASLAHGQVRETRVSATELVEFEEVEDEGACWAFQVEPRRMLFITGQQYYADEQFPAADFSILEPLLPSGSSVTEWLEVHGPKLLPTRTVAATVKWMHEMPEHLETVEAEAAWVESALPVMESARKAK